VSLQAALLRGVNLGGRKVVMSELRAACEAAGFSDVRTLLASGNLVLGSKLSGETLERKLEAVIADALGLKTDVFVRSPAALTAIIGANPFAAFAKKDPSHLVVLFMRGPLSAAQKGAFAAHAGPEQMQPGKGCLYITYPDGIGESKLKVPALGTARNWNTVLKLAAMTARA
jgi:uncharacterized protein (DUF1697 family)